MARKTSEEKSTNQPSSYWQKLEGEVQNNQSRVSMILGGLIILVVIVLIFNFFNKNKSSLGPAQNTQNTENTQQDVLPENLPGTYSVKEGDTLFTIAQKYYNDGYKFTEISKANNLTNPDAIEADQVLEIPKIESMIAAQETPAPSPQPTTSSPSTPYISDIGSATMWGPKIVEDTYTVVEDDWLSKIAERAYGDILAFNRIAKANNISNPNHIEPGMVLTIPR